MKLLFCPDCQDIKKLQFEMTFCKCKRSSGQYNNYLDAAYFGKAVPIGITNSSFSLALFNWIKNSNTEKGIKFTSFIMPKTAKSITIY